MRLIEVEWEQLEPLLDPDEAVRRNELVEEPNHDERGDIERGLAEADVVVEAEYRTQSVLHNSMETHQSICQWEGDDHLTVYISTQFVWGVRERRRQALRPSRGSRARRLPLHGRRLRLQERPRATTRSSEPSLRGRPAGRSRPR